jgi:hypothetical protein
MKISKRGLAIILVLTVLVCSTTAIKIVSAQSSENSGPTNTQIQLVHDNCLTLKTTLNQVHASDALLRVNMGELYEAISTKLMSGFNGRVANNNLNNDNLVATTNSYNSLLNNFRTDYQTYEEQLSSALNIDCNSQPADFYNAVASARTDRDQVHQDVVGLNQAIETYKSNLSQFEQDYTLSLEGTAR